MIKPQVTIDAPHLLTRKHRVRDTLLTAIIWALYFYLWLPALSLVAWLLGIEFAYDVMVRAGGVQSLSRALPWYGLVVLIIFIVITGWSASQHMRFAGKNRRAATARISDAALHQASGLTEESFGRLRDHRFVSVSFDDSGTLQSVADNTGETQVA
jgi:biofilm PGA synthesis protein PgaD